jgi:protein-S-isoprenylcysteine O-methyltransferase Ste14
MKLRSFGLFLENDCLHNRCARDGNRVDPVLVLGHEARILFQPWTATSFMALLPLSLGAAIYFRCLWEFAARGRGIPLPIDHPRQLVVTGLYRYVRNPMYVGVLILLSVK